MMQSRSDRTDYTYREEAIPLVSVDPKTNKFTINNEAIDFLNSIKGNIGVISVAGMYRTGKSYLLNRVLLDRSSGFGVGPSINPCTKGIWLWTAPLTGQTPEGDPITVLILDSEGIGALDEDSTHDSRIFSLAILLSSCFLYNSTGSIDENAVQNLSLIVNLTKNIHIKSSLGNGDEPDSEDYAKYFPNFVWVVRDFTLQLVDSEGEPISTKEYLERALAPQKGFSDGIEQKNRIRRLLTSFFKERECFTLVRPLTNEEDLQNLDQLDLDQLRPEFASQVITFRRFMLNRVKPKAMNNKILNGPMYAELVKSYITAINEGAVPNIENAWSYVCRNECMKAMVEGIETYDALAREVMNNKLPLSAEELKNYHAQGKEKALALFKKKAIGEAADEYVKELRKKIKQKSCNLRLENDREFNRVATAFINREYTAIEKKLKNNEYKSLNDFEKELRLFQSFFLESGPNGPNKKLFVIEYLQKCFADAANTFMKTIQQELQVQKMISQDIQKKLDQEINDLKNENSKEKQMLSSRISQLEFEKSEAEIKERDMRETFAQIKEEKEKFEKELRSEWQSEKDAMSRTVEELRNKLSQAEENIKEAERKIFLSNSEFEKEKALLKQKADYYEKSLEELSSKEKDLSTQVKNSQKEHLSTLKENSAKYENLTKSLQATIDQLQERLSELETETVVKTQKYDTDKKRWEEKEQALSKRLEEDQALISNLKEELANNSESQSRNIDEYKEENTRIINDLTEKLKQSDNNLKQKEELHKTTKSSFEKEKAIMHQKIEFLELQLNEAKTQNNETKRAYEAALLCFDSNNQSSGDASRQMEELKETHKTEIRQLEAEFENIKKKMNLQFEQLQEKYNELELNSKLQTSDLNKEIDNLKENLEQSEEQKKYLTEQNKILESQKSKLFKEAEDRYSSRIKSLEAELEEQNTKLEQDLIDINIKNDENLAQLRNFYEIEKERLERRITEEKDRAEKKVSNLVEEYEGRIKEEQNLHEEELDNIKEELREVEIQNATLTQQYEHELMLRQQTIESLEKYLKEAKESLTNVQTTNSTALETHLNNFANERTQLITKIENLTQEAARRDREIFSLQQVKERLESSSAKKEANFEKVKTDLTNEKNTLTQKLEETKAKLQSLSDEFLEKKVESNRELALSQQQNEFLNKKIEELQKQLDEVMKRYEEKLKIMKEEYSQELQEKNDKYSKEKADLQANLDKIKKGSAESESVLTKQLSQLGKDKALLQEKLNTLELRLGDADQRMNNDNQNYATQLAQLKENFNAEKKFFTAENEKYKAQYIELEQQLSEVSSNYEKDKALWKGKLHFLEQQREQTKNDLNDAQKKFEMTLQQLQKFRKADKEENENTQSALSAAIEKRHQTQIQELNELHQQKIAELEEKYRKLEKEFKSANDKLLVENYGKIGNQAFIEKRISEMAENEKRLLAELENVKLDRDNKALEYQKGFDKERDQLKGKIADVEQKFRESESKRSTLVLEHEKQKAKWNLEKDHLMNQKTDLQENIMKLEKKREALLRENEKLKSETKINRRSGTLGGGFVSSSLLKSTNTASKMKPASPVDSRDSAPSIDTHGSKQFEKNTLGFGAYVSGSTVITSDDES